MSGTIRSAYLGTHFIANCIFMTMDKSAQFRSSSGNFVESYPRVALWGWINDFSFSYRRFIHELRLVSPNLDEKTSDCQEVWNFRFQARMIIASLVESPSKRCEMILKLALTFDWGEISLEFLICFLIFSMKFTKS